MYVKNNTIVEEYAEGLCQSIIDYWHGAGYNGIDAWIIKTPRMQPGGAEDHKAVDFHVRSNIGPRGFPPREINES